MPLVRRTVELIVALVVASVALALFLGFFFFWVIAPVSAIAAFYIVYLVGENKHWFDRLRGERRGSERATLLRHEADVRAEESSRRRAG
jgi:hypothetical protein